MRYALVLAQAKAEYDAWVARGEGRIGSARGRRKGINVGNYPRQRLATCHRGHPYSDANTYIDRHGNRTCRACRNETARIRRSQKNSRPSANRRRVA